MTPLSGGPGSLRSVEEYWEVADFLSRQSRDLRHCQFPRRGSFLTIELQSGDCTCEVTTGISRTERGEKAEGASLTFCFLLLQESQACAIRCRLSGSTFGRVMMLFPA